METLRRDVEKRHVSPVEREPMWDGNTLGGSIAFLASRVEREPMWDGNKLCTQPNSHEYVEREPMWDGNGSRSLITVIRLRVEREPMWDGNPGRPDNS